MKYHICKERVEHTQKEEKIPDTEYISHVTIYYEFFEAYKGWWMKVEEYSNMISYCPFCGAKLE